MRLSFLFSLAIALLFSGCVVAPKGGPEPVYLQAKDFKDLPGWNNDAAKEALGPFGKSCAKALTKKPDADFGAGGYAGQAAAWQDACRALPPDTASDADARKYFEDNFTPYELSGKDGSEGLFTGYYEPLLHGSSTQHASYLIPLYARPTDMVSVDLSDFKPDLKGSITGRVTQGKDSAKLVPYYTRAEIENGAIATSDKIVWVDNAVDAFFLHIQGSGVVQMDDGRTLQVGYAAQNGQPYVAIGRELVKRGELQKPDVSMQAIRKWLDAHPAEAPAVMDLNASYVFFRVLTADGALGAEGVALTPGRSLAVDNHKIPYGAPLWLDTQDPDGKSLQRLMVAQDTGGAITGAVRGDFFWGPGPDAADKAGRMQSRGHAFILLPKSVRVPETYKH